MNISPLLLEFKDWVGKQDQDSSINQYTWNSCAIGEFHKHMWNIPKEVFIYSHEIELLDEVQDIPGLDCKISNTETYGELAQLLEEELC